MQEVLPKIEKKKQEWNSNDVRISEARKEVERALHELHGNDCDVNREACKIAKTNLSDTYTKVEEERISERIDRIEECEFLNKHRECWEIINELSNKKSTKAGQLKGDTVKERVDNWLKHFQDLLGQPSEILNKGSVIEPICSALDIKESPFDSLEYRTAVNNMKEGKSTGEDGITTEVLKRCHLDEIVLDFCNQALLEGKRPDQWVLMNIVPIPKGGDLSLGENHRGITLMSIVAKLFNKMLLNRIRSSVDKELRKNQNGFRIGRSTIGQVLAIRRLIEGVKRKNLSAILTFVDFKKAFDTIHRGMMFDILRAYGIPERIVKAIECMYRGTKAKVLSPDGETELFEIKAGVLQGDTLAPLLFIIVLDYALRKATIGREEELGFQLSRRQSRRVRPVVVTDLDFADDIALLSEEIQQTQLLLTSVETCCAEVGLKINAKKTEYITLNVEDAPNLTTISGRKLKCVDDFKYLGAWIRDTQKDIKVRKAIAWSVAHKLKKVWLSRMTRKLKVRLFETAVIPVLTYGSETWTTTVSDIKGLDGCFTRLLRFALNVHWSERMTNEDLYGEIPCLSNRLKRKRLEFAGHMVRAQEEIGSRFVLWEPKRGIANRGRPMKNYIDVIRDDTGLKTTDEIRNVMENREIWKTYL